MSVSIYFHQLKEQEVDRAWDEIMSGEFKVGVEPELERLEKEEKELATKIPVLEDPTFSYYSKDPAYAAYAEASAKHVAAEEQLKKLQGLKRWEQDTAIFKKQFDQAMELDEELEQAIMDMNRSIIAHFSEQNFTEYYSHRAWDDYVRVLFGATLSIDIEKQDYYNEDSMPGIPFDIWVKAFESADQVNMMAVKGLASDFDFTFEDFTDHILPVKNLVKFCRDTNTKMIAYFEYPYSHFEEKRAKEIYQKYKSNKI